MSAALDREMAMLYNSGTMQKHATSFRLTVEAMAILAALARNRGIARTDVLEIVLRQERDREWPLKERPAPADEPSAGRGRKE